MADYYLDEADERDYAVRCQTPGCHQPVSDPMTDLVCRECLEDQIAQTRAQFAAWVEASAARGTKRAEQRRKGAA